MNEERNKDVVRQAYQAFKTGDMETLLGIFSEDIEWRTPDIKNAPFYGNFKGREKCADFFRKLDEAEEFEKFEPGDFLAEGDRVVVLGAAKAHVRETNRKYETDWIHIFTLSDGKITKFIEFMDTAAANSAYQKAEAA